MTVILSVNASSKLSPNSPQTAKSAGIGKLAGVVTSAKLPFDSNSSELAHSNSGAVVSGTHLQPEKYTLSI